MTKEGEFARLIFFDGEAAPVGVIVTRYRSGIPAEEQANLLARLAADDSPIKIEGMYTLIEEDFIRQRPLPPRVQNIPIARDQGWHRHRN